jgi:hypothetical protein
VAKDVASESVAALRLVDLCLLYRSFAGEYDEVIPHLTAASSSNEDTLATVAAAVSDALPIQAHARDAYLMVHVDGRWLKRSEFSLGLASHGVTVGVEDSDPA